MALERRSQVAYQLQTHLEVRPEIEQCCEGSAIRQQRFPRKMRENVIGGAKAVRPHEPTVFPNAPTVHDVSGGNLLSVRRAAEHQPLQSDEFRPRRDLDLCATADTRAIEDDRFLW